MGNVRGFTAVKKALARQKARLGDGLEIGLMRAGLYLMAASSEIVPVEEGILRAGLYSLKVEGTSGLNTIVENSYTADYGTWVHEDLTKRHGKIYNAYYADEIKAGRLTAKRPQEQAKFLEKPAREERSTLMAIVADAVKASGS